MKICYVANSESSHTVKWVNYFLNLGHEVHVISHEDNKIPGAYVYYIDYNIKNFIFKAKKVHELIKNINPDIVHAHQANTCGLYATTAKGYKVIVSTWGSDILVAPKESIIMKFIVKYVLKHAHFITSDSQYMTNEIIKLGASKDKCYTFPMGVEADLLQYSHKYDETGKLFNILSNRRLEKMYNIDIIIRGFYKASLCNDKLRLTIAADGSEKEKLIELVNDYNMQDKVIFKGSYNHKELCTMLEENDVFISIPESDSTSVSLLESMCCGVFPIVCDLPANREWVVDKDNGLVLSAINDEEIKNAILWCYDNIKYLQHVSLRNTNIIKEKALWENNAQIVKGLYNRIIKI